MEKGNASAYRTIERLKAKIDWDLAELEAREIEAMPREEKERALAEAGIDVGELQQRISALLSDPAPQGEDPIDPQP